MQKVANDKPDIYKYTASIFSDCKACCAKMNV